MNPHVFPCLKFIFDFSFDSSPHLTYRHPMNIKDGFTGSLQIGDKLFPESIELGLGDVVTAENIDELTRIFTNESLSLNPMQNFNLSAESVAAIRTAIADSIATGQCVTVPITDLENTLRFIGCHYDDCDFDCFLNQTTIFGDDPSIPVSEEGDGYEAHFVLNLVCPKQTRFTAIFRKPSGEIVTDSLSYHDPMNEALDAAHEDAHRYGWAFVSLQTITA
jgi:hypothetical protein